MVSLMVLLMAVSLVGGCKGAPPVGVEGNSAPEGVQAPPARASQPAAQLSEQEKGEWITTCLKDMLTIKEGMTREQLLEVFATEGGLSSPSGQTFVYPDCPYMKVDVTFETERAPEGHAVTSPTDKIKIISRPYLAWSVGDQLSVEGEQQALVRWVEQCLSDMLTIKEGMTRGQLLEVFATEGGLSSPSGQTFVYPDCPYMKVDVTFETERAPEGHTVSSPTDKVKTISRPYLAWSIID
jgi:hypothetical protein